MAVTLSEFKQAFSPLKTASLAEPPALSEAPFLWSAPSDTATPAPAPSSLTARKQARELLDLAIDDALGKAEKRAKALITWNVHKYSDDNAKVPELDKYFADLESGIAKVNEHAKYVSEVLAAPQRQTF